MKISKFDYTLPKSLIANTPALPRDHSKLLILNRNSGEIEHKHFYDIVDYLDENDVLVFNNTKVFPARLIGKKDTGGKVELLLLETMDKKNNIWKAIYKGKIALKTIVYFNSLNGTIIEIDNGIALVQFAKDYDETLKDIDIIGHTPLPPYITNLDTENNLRKKYQTVYAKEKGSAAAPTAGFHFTDHLLTMLKEKGIRMEFITLHVGLGTFTPVKSESLEEHKMHSEYYEIDESVAKSLNKAKEEGKRIIAVGTTTVRTLESSLDKNNNLIPQKTKTNIFIYPPHKFKFTDCLITNFHLPKSTLLALVSAFVSKPNTNNTFINFQKSIVGKAYFEAIKSKYSFYSFGDAMFIQ